MTPTEIHFGRPWITDEEREAVLRVLSTPILTHGPECKAFEAEFGAAMGSDAHCVSVSSCMAALHLACLQFGIGPGDEVILPALTHVAAAHAVEWVGARPVFVDCTASTGNIDIHQVEQAITPRTKAISLVHFAGIPCNMPELMAIAERHHLRVIEDCAIAIGARFQGKHVGLFGDAGCFSFYPVKHMTTGEGGMFVTRHPDVANAVQKLRAFGVDRTHQERSIPGMYDVPSLGLNYRMSELQAAIGRAQVGRLATILQRRRQNFEALKHELRDIQGAAVIDADHPEAQNSHYCLVLLLDESRMRERNAIVQRLSAAKIGTSVYYPQPVPRMAYYKNKYGYAREKCLTAERFSDGSIALPVGQHLTERDMKTIAQAVRTTLKEVQNG